MQQSSPEDFQSIWTATTPATNFPTLQKDSEVDVVVIGGGMAGLNAAYFLKQAGFKVVVLEANRIASGTSGNTTAKVTSLHELRYFYLKESLSLDAARIYADANEWAIKKLENIIKKENIGCDFFQTSAFTYTRKEEDVKKIEKEVEAAKQLKLPASFVSNVESVPFKISGAVKFDMQAYFHPRKYLLAIADIVYGNGSFIFERTRALDIEEGKLCLVKTNKKNVRAKFVLIATNFPFYDPKGLFSKLSRVGSYALAVKLEGCYPEGMFLGTGDNDLSFRPHKDEGKEWLIIGGKHRDLSKTADIDASLNELNQLANKNFKISAIEYKWGAQDTMSLDLIPHIGKLPYSKNIFVTTGFSSWGMTTSIFSAKLLTDLILGRSNDWQDLYDPERLRR